MSTPDLSVSEASLAEDFMESESSSLCSELELSAPEMDASDASISEPEAELIDSDLEDLYESFDYEGDSGPSQVLAAEGVTHTENGIPTRLFDGSSRSTLSAPIYPGAVLTVIQSYLLIFQYIVRHSLTTKAFTELLQLLSVHVPLAASIPKSVYSLKRFFVHAYPECNSIQHWYCSCCQRPLPAANAVCTGSGCAGGPPAVFITIPLGPQIRRLMEGV